MKTPTQLKFLLSTAALLISMGVGGYVISSTNTADAEPVQAAAKPQALPVSVLKIQQENIRLWNHFSGRLKAIEEVDLQPQVRGTIVDIRFEDGQMVKKGDVLFVIDPRTYESAVRKSKAELDTARQNVVLAKKEKIRAEQLLARGNISKRVFDERVNTFTVMSSDVRHAIATLEQDEISLDYAYVKSPIDGRASRIEITRGNYVSVGANAPTLTTIVSTDGIYADFEIDEHTYLSNMYQKAQSKTELTQIPVQLQVGETTTVTGFIHSFDNRIDPQTGTIRARAFFDNKEGRLLPGMFAKLSLGTPKAENLILLSPKAISTDQNRKFVYTVSAENTVEYRQITLGASQDGRRVVTSGLKSGDSVIVEGIMKIRPGMPVSPQTAKGKIS
ncbi:MAG: efflux RND transporter periplasmic adaptor subunit [Sneathiella sp.]